MLQTGRLQIASIATASVLLAYAVAGASFAAQGKAGSMFPEIQYAEAANVDYFLKINGVEGESTSGKHKGEIEVLSFSWGAMNLDQSSSGGGGGGVGSGKVSVSDISFTARTSKASPALFLKAAKGEHIREAVLTGEVSGKNQQQFMTVKLQDVLITSYQQDGASGDVPTDSFSLNFAKIEFTYYPAAGKGGPAGKPVTASWDVRQNREGA
ncbi:type VI secretion system tube protein Hcp [Nitrososphaera sp.]|uniref:Hcp family type VI secretion system effector n=1 Tax=Nitrososphaera sp. TaxID=1971748 RepID=UPI00307EE360